MYQVRYFVAVAEQRNFTRAAERLSVAQPSLTRAIQKLEDELGGPLFRRERANTHLTELGRMMLPHLSASLSAAEAAKSYAEQFAKRETGQLTVGACTGASAELGGPLLRAAAAEIPGLELALVVAPQGELEERLLAGGLDTALLTPLGAAAHERFDFHKVAEDRFVVAFAPAHRFAARNELTLEALDGEGLVVRDACRHEGAIAAAMAARGITRIVRHRAGDERWLAVLVEAGLGVAVLPERVARQRGLRFHALADLPLTHVVALTTVAGRRHSPALAALVRAARRMSAEAIDRGEDVGGLGSAAEVGLDAR